MKILHTSDWHLGHVLYTNERTPEFEAMLRDIAEIVASERPDALLISGDLFHCSSPSATARRIFVEGLLRIREACPDMQIIATAGNHDSPSRIDADSALWNELGITVIGAVVRDEEGRLDAARHIIRLRNGKGVIVALPFIPPHILNMERVREIISQAKALKADDSSPVIVMAHLFASGANTTGHDETIGGLDGISIDDFGTDYDYLALGHIHCPQSIKGSDNRARYCGTPLAVSFDEDYPHGVCIVDVEAGEKPQVRFEQIKPLVPLRTIPSKPAPLDQALEELAKLPDDDECYVRLNVLVKDYLPSNCQIQAGDILRNKAAHLCYIQPTREEQEKEEKEAHEMSISEFRQTSPLDLARRFFQDKYSNPMDDDRAALLSEVISEIEQA